MQLPVNFFKSKTGVKAAAILLIVTFLIVTFASMTMGAPGVTYGDVNNDGDIDVRDVVLVMQYIIGLRNLTDDQLKAADVNFDGAVNVQDATLIMQYVLRINGGFALPVESVKEVEISVPYGTPVDSIDFPDTVTAILQDESEEEIDVEWETTSEPAYNSQSPDDYTFKGDLVDLPAGIANPDEIQAVAVVTVEKINVPAYRSPTDPAPTTYSLFLGSMPENVGTLTGSGSYESGTVVDITATAQTGYDFEYWSAPAGIGTLGDPGSPSTTYTMPSQDVLVTAHFNVGKIENASAADFVYDAESTTWSFEISEVKLDQDEYVTIDLSDALGSQLDYSNDSNDYTVVGFDVDAENAQDQEMPRIVLTAEGDIAAGSIVEITVENFIAVNEYSENTLTFTRNDTGETDTAAFNILEKYSTYQFVYTYDDDISAGEAVYADVTFETEQLGGSGYEGVRFKFENESTGVGDVTFTATDSEDVEHTFINDGYWGPPGGFDVPADYSATTEWTLIFENAGTYTITFSLIDATTEDVIDEISDSEEVTVGSPE